MNDLKTDLLASIKALLKQGCFGYADMACQYLTPTGQPCIAGLWMRGPLAMPLEDLPTTSAIQTLLVGDDRPSARRVQEAFQARYGRPPNPSDAELVQDLQGLHDTAARDGHHLPIVQALLERITRYSYPTDACHLYTQAITEHANDPQPVRES